EGPPQRGQYGGEGVGAQPGQPAVGQAEQLVIVQEKQATAGQEPLGPAGRGRGGGGGGQLARHPDRRVGRGEPSGVEQQPGQPAGNERGTAGNYARQRFQPAS